MSGPAWVAVIPPTVAEMKEAKAAGVVRNFLVGQQVTDFDRHRSFLVTGRDTGHLYRVISRWSPAVERYEMRQTPSCPRRRFFRWLSLCK